MFMPSSNVLAVFFVDSCVLFIFYACLCHVVLSVPRMLLRRCFFYLLFIVAPIVCWGSVFVPCFVIQYLCPSSLRTVNKSRISSRVSR